MLPRARERMPRTAAGLAQPSFGAGGPPSSTGASARRNKKKSHSTAEKPKNILRTVGCLKNNAVTFSLGGGANSRGSLGHALRESSKDDPHEVHDGGRIKRPEARERGGGKSGTDSSELG